MIETTNQVGSAVADPTILTEETYNTLVKITKSNDPENIKLVQVILTQLNIEKSIWWIYQLAKNTYANNLVNLRTKAGRKFRDDANLFMLAGSSEHSFAYWCNKKGWLTPEIFMKCKKYIIAKLKSNASVDPFYTVHIELSEEFKRLDPSDVVQKLK
jgi:hypothetical protein